ncbi:hypothetical protein I5M99_18450 [Serratia marcescens]|nr:hypothetical protein [Serratia marcescens]
MGVEWQYRNPVSNKNRRKKLKDRMKRLIDNTELQGGKKVFLKQGLAEIMQEYAELWECRNGREVNK